MRDTIRDKVAIVGIGQTEFSKNSGRSELQLAAEAVKAALDDAGLTPSDVDGMTTFTLDTSDEIEVARAVGIGDLTFFSRVPHGGGAAVGVVHHDKSVAQAQGMQDVFMNILTTNGLVGRYVTDWAGPDAVLRNVAIKLGTPNLPGDTMKMSGTIAAKHDADGTVDVKVTGSNTWGDHVNGTVKLTLPRKR